jgi:hypothetical protein
MRIFQDLSSDGDCCVNRGIIYIATGEKYVEEALFSALSAKSHMPDMPITLFTDIDLSSKAFDSIIQIESPAYGLRDKVQYMKQSPYEGTLFLDTDTYICESVDELFELLNRFDIGLVHDGGYISYEIEGVPSSFPQFNTGVVLYRKSKKTDIFFDDWLKRYDNDAQLVRGRKIDDPMLRAALYHSELSIAPLTSQYNCRFIEGGYVAASVKILHRHSAHNYQTVAEILNRYQGQRVYIADRVLKREVVGRFVRRVLAKTVAHYDKPIYQVIVQRTQTYWRKYGFLGMLRQLMKRIYRKP